VKFLSIIFIFIVAVTLSGCDKDQIARMLKIPREVNKVPVDAAKVDFSNLSLNPKNIEVFAEGFNKPHGLGYLDGFIYLSSEGEKTLYRVNIRSKGREIIINNVNFPHDMIIDQGEVITPLFYQNQLVNINEGEVREIASGFDGPNGIVEFENGWLVSDYNSGSIYKVEQNGAKSLYVAGLSGPAGMVVDLKGNIYVANYLSSAKSIVKITNQKRVETIATQLEKSESLLIDSKDNILIGHEKEGKGAISKLTPDGKLSLVLQTQLETPIVGPITDGVYLYFVSASGNDSKIYRVKF